MSNLVLNTPISSLNSKTDYDNKILYLFLGLMVLLIFLGLAFVDLTKQLSTVSQQETDQNSHPHVSVSDYV